MTKDTNPTRFAYWGYPEFSLGLSWIQGRPGMAEMKLWMSSVKTFVWGERWPGGGIEIDAAAALRGIAERWHLLAKAYAGPDAGLDQTLPDGDHDLADVFGLPASERGKAVWATSGADVSLITSAQRQDFRSETILAIEILAGAANWLATGLREQGAVPEAEAWASAFRRTDILPAESDGFGQNDAETADQALEREMRQARFYCRRLNLDLDRYVRRSVWLLAEQGRAALSQHPEGGPDWHGLPWDAPGIADLPTLDALEASTSQDIRNLYAAGYIEEGQDLPWSDFVACALAQRTIDLRAELYFERHRKRAVARSGV